MEINQVQMSNWRFGIVVVIIGKPPLMGEVLCSTENSPFLIIDHIHAKINRVCCAALAIGKKCMNVRKNKLLTNENINMSSFKSSENIQKKEGGPDTKHGTKGCFIEFISRSDRNTEFIT